MRTCKGGCANLVQDLGYRTRTAAPLAEWKYLQKLCR
jgi:hypothetical protein